MASWKALDAVWAKYRRALEDLKALREDAGAFIDMEPYPVEVEFDADSGWYVAHIRIAQEPPPTLSVLVGSIAYQCYSALNHIVWELVGRKTGRRLIEHPDVRRHIAFPICKRRADLTSLYTYKHVSKPAQAILDDLQPYQSNLAPKEISTHSLFLMKDLADLDKHRVLATSYGEGRLGSLFTGQAFGWDESAQGLTIDLLIQPAAPGRVRPMLKSHTPLVRLRFDRGNPQANVYVKRQPPAEVVFAASEYGGLTVTDIGLIVGTTDKAITRLAALFPGQSWPPVDAIWPT
jgi:hypothetical protein